MPALTLTTNSFHFDRFSSPFEKKMSGFSRKNIIELNKTCLIKNIEIISAKRDLVRNLLSSEAFLIDEVKIGVEPRRRHCFMNDMRVILNGINS